MPEHPHDWQPTGVRDQHVAGEMFKYGTPVVSYVRCRVCGRLGFRKPDCLIVYTWD